MEIGGKKLKDIPKEDLYNRIDNFDEGTFYDGYRIAKIEYGDTAGYHRTELIYPSELTLNAGEAVTAMLDKIKNMLGNFEYFYDLDGRFVFQKQRTYTQGVFSPLSENGGAIAAVDMEEYIYRFEDAKILTNLSNAPNLSNIKNDFSIWGNRKSASGADVPIHSRYAIQKKPEKYKTLDYYTGYHLCYLEPIKATKENKSMTIYEKNGINYIRQENQNEIKENSYILKEFFWSFDDNEKTVYYKDGDNYKAISLDNKIEWNMVYTKNKDTKAFTPIGES
jgi:hypothetical protein